MKNEYWVFEDDGTQDEEGKGEFRPGWGIQPVLLRNGIDYGREELERIAAKKKNWPAKIVKVKFVKID